MKYIALLILTLTLLSSCKKKHCYTCSNVTYDNGVKAYNATPDRQVCDKSETEIKSWEQQNNFADSATQVYSTWTCH